MSKFKHKALPILMVLTILSFSAVAFVPAAIAAPATFTVNSLLDDEDFDVTSGIYDGVCETQTGNGICTLRAAIQEANATVDADTIEFNIGAGTQTITPATKYDDITEQLTIDGYTNNPGATANTAASPNPLNGTINIEIDGQNVNDDYGFKFLADNSRISGISLFNFHAGSNDGQISVDADGVIISGNYLGVVASGLLKAPLEGDGRNDAIVLFYSGRTGSVLGGENPQDRNIVANFSYGRAAIQLDSDDGYIYGNYIGIGKDGVTDLDSGLGVQIGTGSAPGSGTNNTVGGNSLNLLSETRLNLLSGNANAQVAIVGNSNNVLGNLIGTDYTGALNPGITNGVGLGTAFTAEQNVIGGIIDGDGNIFKGLSGTAIGASGVLFPGPFAANPNKNAFLGNSISEVGVYNVWEGVGNFDSNLGIDHIVVEFGGGGLPIGYINSGLTPNDDDGNPATIHDGDADEGANNYINAPVLKTSQQVANQLTVTYNLDIADSPSDDYRIEFFASDEASIFGAGPGQVYLGFENVNLPGGVASDNESVTLTVSGDITNKALSATATAIDAGTTYGFGSTSEFSTNLSVGSSDDADSDGIANSVEDGSPNGGDSNDDGTDDSTQGTVTSYPVDGNYVTLVTDGCSENGNVSLIDEEQLPFTDGSLSYPYGLTNFVLNCSVGGEVTVDILVFANDNEPGDLTLRKYRENDEVFEALAGAEIIRETIGTESALTTTYSLVDGGPLDDDGTANGIIVDPVGFALTQVSSIEDRTRFEEPTTVPTASAQGTLSATGANTSYLANISIAILFLGFIITVMVKVNPKKEKIYNN